jgi:large subunit ribosomal protein L33
MAKKGDRVLMTLQCTDCRERNYHSSKNRRNDPGRMERQKYCARCGGSRLHREVR